MLVNNRAGLSVGVKKKTRVVFSLSLPHSLWFFVPRAGIEPARPKAQDFESSASTSSATEAFRNWCTNLILYFNPPRSSTQNCWNYTFETFIKRERLPSVIFKKYIPDPIASS
jgi:hypothetical protein